MASVLKGALHQASYGDGERLEFRLKVADDVALLWGIDTPAAFELAKGMPIVPARFCGEQDPSWLEVDGTVTWPEGAMVPMRKLWEGDILVGEQSGDVREFELGGGRLRFELAKGGAWMASLTKAPRPMPERLLVKELATDPNGDRRYALGVVLEPDPQVKEGGGDLQGDTYTEEEVRKAFEIWTEKYRAFSVDHNEEFGDLANGKIVLLDNCTTLTDLTEFEGKTFDPPIKKGAWLQGVRYVDDELWEKVKKGEYSGFSIWGKAHEGR